MALVNADGNYMKVTSFDIEAGTIFANIYKDQNTRHNAGEFDNVVTISHQGPELKSLCESDEFVFENTLFDSVKKACYEVLKNEPAYSSWTDA